MRWDRFHFKPYIFLYLLLFMFWQFINGWNLTNIITGSIVSMIITVISKYLFGDFDNYNWLKPSKLFLFLELILRLVYEIIISNLTMASIVLSPEMPVSPGIIYYRTNLKSDLLRVILANTITLTPGTLTAEIDGDQITVHVISEKSIEGILNNKIEKVLVRIEEV